MVNITKLKIWADLQKLGFEPIRYRFHGRTVTVGASLRRKLTDISGKDFYTDIITIEPSISVGAEKYHISGEYKTPFIGKFYQYDTIGRKEEIYLEVAHENEFYNARSIMPVIEKMLS